MEEFVVLPDEYKNNLITLSDKTLEQIGTDIFEIESIEDLKKYFQQ